MRNPQAQCAHDIGYSDGAVSDVLSPKKVGRTSEPLASVEMWLVKKLREAAFDFPPPPGQTVLLQIETEKLAQAGDEKKANALREFMDNDGVVDRLVLAIVELRRAGYRKDLRLLHSLAERLVASHRESASGVRSKRGAYHQGESVRTSRAAESEHEIPRSPKKRP